MLARIWGETCLEAVGVCGHVSGWHTDAITGLDLPQWQYDPSPMPTTPLPTTPLPTLGPAPTTPLPTLGPAPTTPLPTLGPAPTATTTPTPPPSGTNDTAPRPASRRAVPTLPPPLAKTTPSGMNGEAARDPSEPLAPPLLLHKGTPAAEGLSLPPRAHANGWVALALGAVVFFVCLVLWWGCRQLVPVKAIPLPARDPSATFNPYCDGCRERQLRADSAQWPNLEQILSSMPPPSPGAIALACDACAEYERRSTPQYDDVSSFVSDGSTTRGRSRTLSGASLGRGRTLSGASSNYERI